TGSARRERRRLGVVDVSALLPSPLPSGCKGEGVLASSSYSNGLAVSGSMRGPWPLPRLAGMGAASVLLGAGGRAPGLLRVGGISGAMAGDEFHRQPSEDVVHEALGHGDLGIAAHPAGLEANVLELAH